MLRSVFAGVVVIESFDQLLIVSSAGKNLFRRFHEFISLMFFPYQLRNLGAESVLVLELVFEQGIFRNLQYDYLVIY